MFFACGLYLSQCVISDASDHLFYWSFLCDRISGWWDRSVCPYLHKW